MRYVFLILLFLGIMSCSEDKQFIGKEPTYSGTPLSVRQLLDKKLLNSTVQMQGRISNICKAEGCWFIISQDQSSLRCTFESPSIFMDTSNLNKVLTVEGKLTEEIVDAETAIMYAEQAGDSNATMEGNKKRVPVFVVSTILNTP